MSESKITTIFKGEFVQVDMVDETIELTVEDNVYSRSESLELLEELKMACAASRTAKSMVGMREVEDETYSEKMQDELEPIDCDVVGGMITHVGGIPVDWTYHTTDDYLELEDE